jgi:hypothetical protein
MGTLDTMIDLGFLKDKDACEKGIVYFETQIAEPIAARELINRLLAADDVGKIWWVNWLLCRLFTRPQYIQYAIFSAEQVLSIFEAKYPADKRPREAIEAAKQVLIEDNEGNRAKARAAADEAYVTYSAANAANTAANAAAYAAYAAGNSLHSAAYLAVNAAAYAAHATYAAGGKEMLLKIISFGIGLLENKR